MSKKNKVQNKAAAPASGEPDGDVQPYPMTGDIRMGMIIGAVVGALYGIAYATIPKIVKLDVGPVPGVVVGLFFGAGFGLCFGGYMGGIGKGMLKPKAIMGFVGGFLLMLIGRMADDTGGAIDKIMDILVGGSFWGSVGAIAGAVGVFDREAKPAEEPVAKSEAAKSATAPSETVEADPVSTQATNS